MEKESKVKLLISAEGDMNKPNEFKINLVAEGGGFQISCVLAGLIEREHWLRNVLEQALEMVYEE